MLVLKNISKTFGSTKALDNINFCLKKGEVASLLGANGAGKTTLMRIICGVLSPDLGTAEIFNSDIATQRTTALKKIGYMPENNPLYQDLSVLEFLTFMAKIRNISLKDIQQAITTLNLEDVINKKIEFLSKGFKSRTAIAAALLAKPKLLVLDEPTEGLDPNQKHHLRQVLKAYAKDNIVLISTHIIEEAEELNSRILVLNKGKLIRDSSVEELKNQNKNQTLSATLRKIMEEI